MKKCIFYRIPPPPPPIGGKSIDIKLSINASYLLFCYC